MPNPWGEVLGYKKAYGMTNPVAFINVENTISSNYAARYASDVYQYLEQKGFNCLCAIDGVIQYNAPSVSKYAYAVKEATSLVDFHDDVYYSVQSRTTGAYVFVYSEGDVARNDDGNKHLAFPHCIVISDGAFIPRNSMERMLSLATPWNSTSILRFGSKWIINSE